MYTEVSLMQTPSIGQRIVRESLSPHRSMHSQSSPFAEGGCIQSVILSFTIGSISLIASRSKRAHTEIQRCVQHEPPQDCHSLLLLAL